MSNDELLNMNPPALGNKEGGCNDPTLVTTSSIKTIGNEADGAKGNMEIEGPLDPIHLSQELTAVGHTEGKNSTPVLTTGTQVEQHTNSSSQKIVAAQDIN